MSISRNLVAAILSGLLVTSCGSSKDSGSGSDPTQVGKVAGAVVKGIIQQGVVQAYALDANGNHGSDAVGTATTGNDGSYELAINSDYDGVSPLLLELTADSSTKMLCDAANGCGPVNRGEILELSANSSFDLSSFKMTAIIPAVAADGAVTAQITPLTHVAAKTIQASLDTSTANIAVVTSRVNQLAGVDILSTEPVNIADNAAMSGADANQQRYTVILAALANQLFEDNNASGTVGPDDLVANLEDIANDFALDNDFGDTDGLRVGDLFSAVNNEVNNSVNNLSGDVKTSLTQHITVLSAQTENGIFTPKQTSGNNPDEVARAKSLVTEVRTLGTLLSELESPADAFTDKANVIVDTLDQNSKAVTEVFLLTVNTVLASIDSTTGAVPSSVTISNDGQQLGVATVTNTSDGTKQEYTIAPSEINNVSVSGTITVNGQLSSALVVAGDTTFTITGSASNANSKVSLTDANYTITLADDYTRGDASEDSKGPNVSGITLAGKIAIEALNSGVATDEKVSGSVEIKFVTLDESVKALDQNSNFSLEKIAIDDLSLTDDANSSAGLSISLTVDNANRFDTIGFLNQQPTMYQNLPNINFASFTTELETAKASFPAITSRVAQLHYTSWNNRTCASGYNDNNEFVTTTCLAGDVANLIPWFNAETSNTYGQSYVSATPYEIYANSFRESYAVAKVEFSDMETAESFLDATLTITGNIDLADHPEAILTMTADKTGLKAGSFTAKLGYDDKSMELIANTTDGTKGGTSGDLTFTNADNVTMKVTATNGSATNGSVIVGNKVVGVMEEISGGAMIIRYNDGTFESL